MNRDLAINLLATAISLIIAWALRYSRIVPRNHNDIATALIIVSTIIFWLTPESYKSILGVAIAVLFLVIIYILNRQRLDRFIGLHQQGFRRILLLSVVFNIIGGFLAISQIQSMFALSSSTCRFSNEPPLRSSIAENDSLQEQLDNTIVIEAEKPNGSVPGSGSAASFYWTPDADPSYLNGTALMAATDIKLMKPFSTSEKTNGPALYYKLQFTSGGSYYIHVRGFAPHETEGRRDSIHIGLAGEQAITTIGSRQANGIGMGFRQNSPNPWQHQYNLETSDAARDAIVCIPRPGVYLLYIWMREDGVIIDRIVLSKSLIAPAQLDQLPESRRKS